jgi:chemotaxis methyl-accepting protein methylase/nitrogen-specific signal transduction histidine kinase
VKKPGKSPIKSSPAPASTSPNAAPFYIVGIGASAGGLPALEQFFSNMPADTGVAFVLIQHLEPTQKDMMAEILGRFTALHVVQAQDRMKVRPNWVYVIPPNAELSILHGRLLVLEPVAPRGQRMPIDGFLRHLASDQREQAIAIILSGMGSDGTLGLKAIKEQGGMVMAQNPVSSKFDSMPRSAINTGLVDFIADAEDLPSKLLQYLAYPAFGDQEQISNEEEPWAGIEKVFVLLREHTGNDFSYYKISTIHRRIERRMAVHQFVRLAQYVRLLQENPHEVELLQKELLIGVTQFFRDPGLFQALQEKILPRILAEHAADLPLRVWTPGCSTGEESYSLAIVLQECFEAHNWHHRKQGIQIFATDLDQEAIAQARRGSFSDRIKADVSPDRLARFFVPDGNGYRVKKEIRDLLVFAPHNLLTDPPFTKIDILCCRNVLIYLKTNAQRQLIPLMHFALNPRGLMILGTAESAGGFDHLFSTVDKKWKVFQRREVADRPRLEFPSPMMPYRPAGPPDPEPEEAEADMTYAAQRALLDDYAPPAVVVTAEGDIVYVNGRTGNYLEPASGKVNHNVFAMAREGLREELGVALHGAGRHMTPITNRVVHVKSNGGVTTINLTVKPLSVRKTPRSLFLIVFEERKTPSGETDLPQDAEALPVAASEVQTELRRTRERLQAVSQQMEATQEELRAANEELQSNNEELQSTNEELNSSKEELQSINEEMQTVNAELQTKIEELSTANNDMKNLLNGIEMATIFLNVDLGIKRFTPQCSRIVNLVPSDIGRTISDFATKLKYVGLIEDARNVLDTLVPKELQVEAADGCWYNMRILPYRTTENVIDGVVITFADITVLKKLEQSLRVQKEEAQDSRTYAENIVATIREPLVVLDDSLRVIFANQCFFDTFQVNATNTQGQYFYEISDRLWDIPALRRLLEDVLPHQAQLQDFRVEHDFPVCGHKVLLLNARRIESESARGGVIMLAIEDVTGLDRGRSPAQE